MNGKKAKAIRRNIRYIESLQRPQLTHTVTEQKATTVTKDLCEDVPVTVMSMQDFLLQKMTPSPEMQAKKEELIGAVEELTGKPIEELLEEHR